MRVSVFGLGYVGCVSAACLANEGNAIVGVDTNELKVDMINAGESPVIEEGLAELVARSRSSGLLSATTDALDAVARSDLSLICVGTPSNPNGSLDTTFLTGVCQEVGRAIAEKKDYHTIVIRSTTVPGTVSEILVPDIERFSHKKLDETSGWQRTLSSLEKDPQLETSTLRLLQFSVQMKVCCRKLSRTCTLVSRPLCMS